MNTHVLPAKLMNPDFTLSLACEVDLPDPKEAGLSALGIAREKYDPARGTLADFLRGVLSNFERTDQRRESRRRARFEPLDDEADLPAESAEEVMERLMDHLDRRELRRAMAQTLRRLPRVERRILWLRFWRNLTFAQIADRPEFRSLSVSALKCRISRRYRCLRPQLAPLWPRASAWCHTRAKTIPAPRTPPPAENGSRTPGHDSGILGRP